MSVCMSQHADAGQQSRLRSCVPWLQCRSLPSPLALDLQVGLLSPLKIHLFAVDLLGRQTAVLLSADDFDDGDMRAASVPEEGRWVPRTDRRENVSPTSVTHCREQ